MRKESNRKKHARAVDDVLVQFLRLTESKTRRPYLFSGIRHNYVLQKKPEQSIFACTTCTQVFLKQSQELRFNCEAVTNQRTLIVMKHFDCVNQGCQFIGVNVA